MDDRDHCIEEIKSLLVSKLTDSKKWKVIWREVRNVQIDPASRTEGVNLTWGKVCQICRTKKMDWTKIPDLEEVLLGKPAVYKRRKGRVERPATGGLEVEEL